MASEMCIKAPPTGLQVRVSCTARCTRQRWSYAGDGSSAGSGALQGQDQDTRLTKYNIFSNKMVDY